MVKAKRKTKRGRGNDGVLETLLRFEIVVVLFSLIGLYYFLSFSPIRMPAQPLASPPQKIAPLPAQVDSQIKSAAAAAGPPAAESVALSVAVGSPEKSAPVAGNKPVAAPVSTDTGSKAKIGALASHSAAAGPELPSSAPEKVLAKKPALAARNSSSSPATAPLSSSVASARKTASAASAPHSHSASRAVPHSAARSTSPLKKNPPPALPASTIVAGDYVLKVKAQESLRKLKSLNFTVRTATVKRPTPMYRLYLGTFSRREKALKIMEIVRKKGDDPFLQAVSGGYNVVISSFYLRGSVIAWENMYQAAGFTPKVKAITLPLPHTLLLLDGPEVQKDPAAVLARLKAAGFNDSHLK